MCQPYAGDRAERVVRIHPLSTHWFPVHHLPPIIHHLFNIHLHSSSTRHPVALYPPSSIYTLNHSFTIHYSSSIHHPPSFHPQFTFQASIFQDVAINHPSSIDSEPTHFIIYPLSSFHLCFHSTWPAIHQPSNHPFTCLYSPICTIQPPFICSPFMSHPSIIAIHIYLPSIHPFCMNRSITITYYLFIIHPFFHDAPTHQASINYLSPAVHPLCIDSISVQQSIDFVSTSIHPSINLQSSYVFIVT